MADLHDLHRPDGIVDGGKRLGRGPGSGRGKTSGRGHKGHKARTGTPHRPWFEGGQMPIQRRVPKRGFTNIFRTEWETVNVRDLDRIEGDEVTPEVLAAHGLVRLNAGRPVKILGDGELERKLTVRVHGVTKGARAKIEAAGGTVEIIGGEARAQDDDAAAEVASQEDENEAASDASET